jgi:hypothetical protein
MTPVPAWRRETSGESRWAAAAAVVVAAALQLSLPARLALGPRWLLPGFEIGLVVLLLVANPGRITRSEPALRRFALLLVAVLSAANTASGAALVHDLLTGHGSDDPAELLSDGGTIYLINIVVFALWYWELDRGGLAVRAAGRREYPDFLFPQMQSPGLADPEWEPRFVDYAYVAFTNVTAFSPTDTLPLSRWAKVLMLLQSALAVVLVALVVARAVNVLQ